MAGNSRARADGACPGQVRVSGLANFNVQANDVTPPMQYTEALGMARCVDVGFAVKACPSSTEVYSRAVS